MQKKYFTELKQITEAAAAHNFPYHFYFSRALGLDEKDQQSAISVRSSSTVITTKPYSRSPGNYFASYSAELMKPDERARQTYQDVMLPLLQAAVPALEKADVPEAFAFEISHHVRKKMLGVSTEGIENVVLILPKASALRLVTATNPRHNRRRSRKAKYSSTRCRSHCGRGPKDQVAKAETAPATVPAPPPAREPPRPLSLPSIPPVS